MISSALADLVNKRVHKHLEFLKLIKGLGDTSRTLLADIQLVLSHRILPKLVREWIPFCTGRLQAAVFRTSKSYQTLQYLC